MHFGIYKSGLMVQVCTTAHASADYCAFGLRHTLESYLDTRLHANYYLYNSNLTVRINKL